MLEQKLIVDRFLNMPARATLDGTPPMYKTGDFVTVGGNAFTIDESTGVFTKSSNISAGSGAKAHRNFLWLPWLPGAVSEVRLGNTDVLTGPMSGCWLMIYRRNAAVHVGHIGTLNNPADPKSVAVKAAWNSFAKQQGTQILGGFNPSQGLFVKAKGDDGCFLVCGLITAGAQPKLYTLWMYSQGKSPAFGGPHRIADLIKMQSAGMAQLQKIA
jgi:hypothetical protein